MAAIWDPETGLSVEILDADGRTVTQEVIYAMVSQRMGFHYGGNFALDGFGDYTARVSVGAVSVERTRGFAGSFGDPATVEIPLAYTEDKRERFTDASPENALEPGAISPMSMGEMPTGILPAPDAMPGRTVGSASADDAVLRGDDPYNQFPLPSMRIAGLFDTGSTTERVSLTRTLDPELNYHYGAPLSGFEAGLGGVERVAAAVEVPPQVTRHAGYETAMLETGPVALR